MNLDFTHKSNSDRLILIIAGWGSDARTFAHVTMPGWDVAVISGIDSQLTDMSDVNKYSTIYMYAWSLGVWTAQYFLGHTLKPTKAYAINGTTTPCDNLTGIPVDIFEGTTNTLNDKNLYKFRVRMCGGLSSYKTHAARFEGINDVERLRRELMFVSQYQGRHASFQWDGAFISMDDKIFPVENQVAAWSDVTDVVRLDAPHYVDMQLIIRQTIVDVARVGKRFSRSMDTYDAHSHAQRLIAKRLVEKMLPLLNNAAGNIIEIGCGTGNLTREWSKYIHAEQAHFVDLCDVPKFGVAGEEYYYRDDAEKVSAHLADAYPTSFSAVLSASTIQWFSNLPLFFHNCARAVKPGGVVALSTFAPGNLWELQSLRPDHLRYFSADELKKMAAKWFKNVQISQEDVVLEFTTPFDALRHLQLTGVTASGSRQAGVGEIRRFADNYPMNDRGRYTLTFKPIYIVAVK